MTTALSTIVAILMMLLSIAYLVLYTIKRKNKLPFQVGYKIAYAAIFLTLLFSGLARSSE